MRSVSAPIIAADVLKEAAELFRTRGYHKTRMQDIAARFGVTHAALYYHFKSKQDILAQINLSAIRDILATARSIAGQELPPEERLTQLVRAHFLWVAENAALASSLLDFDDELPSRTMRKIRDLRREYTVMLRETYAEGVAQGALTDLDPRLAINFIIGAGNWVYRWYHPGDAPSPKDIADNGVRLWAEGFLRRPGGKPRGAARAKD
ncbi:TetR/AcrR family transcriptional regulator [Actinophytocola sp.]|uniref:TetR/AcrR family transcriptional regulator n=1 Tax=Actinophytocola sp. TaxID=1872138 RepID=UPI003D6B35B5